MSVGFPVTATLLLLLDDDEDEDEPAAWTSEVSCETRLSCEEPVINESIRVMSEEVSPRSSFTEE